MSKNVINVAAEFSDMPYGRYEEDGYYNGTRFREELLYPTLKNNPGKITINLDGMLGSGSSFLDEAFGGLVRLHDFTAGTLRERLVIVCKYKSVVKNIYRYIDEAEASKE